MLLSRELPRADHRSRILPLRLMRCRLVRSWQGGVIAFTGVDFVVLFSGGNLNLAKLAIPVLVLGIVAQAVLVVQFVGDLVESSFEFGDAANFQHAPAGGLGKVLEGVFMKDVEHVAFVAAGIVDLQHIGDHVVLQQGLQSILYRRLALRIAGKGHDDDGLASDLAGKVAVRGDADRIVEVSFAVLGVHGLAVDAYRATAGEPDGVLRRSRAWIGQPDGRASNLNATGRLLEERLV